MKKVEPIDFPSLLRRRARERAFNRKFKVDVLWQMEGTGITAYVTCYVVSADSSFYAIAWTLNAGGFYVFMETGFPTRKFEQSMDDIIDRLDKDC